MAHILIDGYNLIGTAHDSLEKARESIIRDLQNYAQIKGHEITIVFDGWKSGQKDQTRTKMRHVTVIYSRLGETADTAIKKILSSSARPWIVVSSDREVSDFAFRKDFVAVHSEEFEFKMHSAFRDVNEIDEDTFLDEELHEYYEDTSENFPSPHKGNPRKLSRTQKKRLQALKKL